MTVVWSLVNTIHACTFSRLWLVKDVHCFQFYKWNAPSVLVGSHACNSCTCRSCSALAVDVASQSKYCLLFLNCQSNKCNFYVCIHWVNFFVHKCLPRHYSSKDRDQDNQFHLSGKCMCACLHVRMWSINVSLLYLFMSDQTVWNQWRRQIYHHMIITWTLPAPPCTTQCKLHACRLCLLPVTSWHTALLSPTGPVEELPT